VPRSDGEMGLDTDGERFEEHGRTKAEELAEKLDIPIELAEKIAREEDDETNDPFVDSEWLRSSD
jgi:hypothetical protein